MPSFHFGGIAEIVCNLLILLKMRLSGWTPLLLRLIDEVFLNPVIATDLPAPAGVATARGVLHIFNTSGK